MHPKCHLYHQKKSPRYITIYIFIGYRWFNVFTAQRLAKNPKKIDLYLVLFFNSKKYINRICVELNYAPYSAKVILYFFRSMEFPLMKSWFLFGFLKWHHILCVFNDNNTKKNVNIFSNIKNLFINYVLEMRSKSSKKNGGVWKWGPVGRYSLDFFFCQHL
jgi:hypothetical protein